MTADLRSLCETLIGDLQEASETIKEWAAYADEYFRQKHDLAGDLRAIDDRIARARAALDAAPTPPPAEGEVDRFVSEQRPLDPELAAVLTPDARWDLYEPGTALPPERQQPRPVPVAERLPTPEDCDAEGRCWWFAESHDGIDTAPIWAFTWRTDDDTHWLPAHALPLPEDEPEFTPEEVALHAAPWSYLDPLPEVAP